MGARTDICTDAMDPETGFVRLTESGELRTERLTFRQADTAHRSQIQSTDHSLLPVSSAMSKCQT